MMYTMYTVYTHLLLVSFYCIDWQLLAESLKLIDIDYNQENFKILWPAILPDGLK